MPHMNRIRVNNVKYNFGTQQYDDFVMRMHGKNTIYDLANGGGKSVLMLLLLQNVIPNCTLDEKQPIEKLFRTSGGSTTIHSLIEWSLDEQDCKDGYRFLLTGFCARKAKDAPDEENSGRDTAAIEYFNYAIMYRAYNANDLVNLPLVKENERVTYQGLRQYLKELERNVPELKVYVFDRKGEYQQFISRFGIYESAWEIVRGINKTEGHVRTYFESNYKTTRKVVEDLLIEQIIETSFRDKTEKDNLNDEMAKTLLDMREKLMELAEKKNEMGRFQHQKELLAVLLSRVEGLRELFQNKEQLTKELRCAYAMLTRRVKEEEQELAKLSQDINRQKEECLTKKKVIACLKVQQEENLLQEQQQEERLAKENCEKCQEKVAQQETVLQQKECVNEYLQYRRQKAKYEEQMAIIAKAKEDSSDYVETLYDLAAWKKQLSEQRERQQEELLSCLETAYEEQKLAVAEGRKKKSEKDCEKAVCKAEQKRLQQVLEQQQAALLEKKNQTHMLLLEDAKEVLTQKQKELDDKEKAFALLQKKEEDTKKEQLESRMRQQEWMLKAEALREQKQQEEDQLGILLNGRKQVEVLVKVYQLTPSPSYQETLRKLREEMQKQFALLCQKIAKNKLEMDTKRKALKSCEQGLLVADDSLLRKVQEYLLTRHNITTQLVQDQLCLQSPKEQEELLHRWPFAPYALSLKGDTLDCMKVLWQDSVLRELTADYIIPLIHEEMLAKEQFHEQTGMLYLHGDARQIYAEHGFAERQAMLSNAIRELEQEYEQLTEASEHMQQELVFVFQQESLLQGYGKQLQQEDALLLLTQPENSRNDSSEGVWEKLQKYEQLLQEEQQKAKYWEVQLAQTVQEKQQMQQKIQLMQKEIATVKEMLIIQEKYEQNTEKLQECQKQLQQAEKAVVQLEEEIAQNYQILQETKQKMVACKEQRKETKQFWKQTYEPYYKKEHTPKTCDWTEEKIDAEFVSRKAIVEQGIGSVQDKQALADTLQEQMQKALQQITAKGGKPEELQRAYEEQALYVTSAEELERLTTQMKQLQKQLADVTQQYSEIQKHKSKREGRVEHGMKQLEEQGIHYQPLDIPKEEVVKALVQQEQFLQEMQKQQKQQEDHYQKKSRDYGKQLDFCKDVKRSMELYHLSMDEEIVDESMLEYSLSQLKQCRSQFEKVMEQEKQAKQELEEQKQRTAQLLHDLQALELAEVIRKDILMPQNNMELLELSDSLKDMIGFLDLEEERVEQSIADMQLIKSNFENQCIRRCQDVKTELERLPKLSGITLDGENIQMISLTIPYLPEEQVAEKMAEYIDNIVKGVERYETFADRMRYIRQQLSLKRLFSVVVTDMNAIRLLLYKRERMKEQSRYLRYEEAVGSTGQSQGIYIQFLIAIINYIANIHSVNSDNNQLGKVIFIDNPFGAAKDIYIWEPIFEMLKTNNVQLIVPARGATPAITGQFDVNYVLGQKMVDGKQQTVVVDYRSQVEKTEMEYKLVEYSQNTFEFV